MRRPQFRVGTLALLVVIVALSAALVIQRRRETALRARLEAMQVAWERERQKSGFLEAYRQSTIIDIGAEQAAEKKAD